MSLNVWFLEEPTQVGILQGVVRGHANLVNTEGVIELFLALTVLVNFSHAE